MDGSQQQQQQALATVQAAWAAYEAGSPDFFDFFTADASIFALYPSTRLNGREAFRTSGAFQGAHPSRAVQLLNAEVRPLGEAVLVTCHERTRSDYNSVDHRITFLLVPEGDGLKIAHLHMSPLLRGARLDTRGLVEDVTTVQVLKKP